MIVKQFFDDTLAHSSYAIVSAGKVALVDPARDITPYEKFAKENDARIEAVLETHPHADFISSHKEFQEKCGAKIYIHPKAGVAYPFEPVGEGDRISLGKVEFKTLFTPGHSPDHNSYLLLNEDGKPHAVFTGDSLFVGDVGRPDLREGAGNITASRYELAGMMYETIRTIFFALPDDVLVYPAHGAGSLCGKNLSTDLHSTIGREKMENWAFQITDKKDFIDSYLEGQSFIPSYFPYDVELNRKGAKSVTEAIEAVTRLKSKSEIKDNNIIVDGRPGDQYKKGHYANSINIMGAKSDKFETWLGSIIAPGEKFYLVAEDENKLNDLLVRTAKIGYEINIKGALVYDGEGEEVMNPINLEVFRNNPDKYTIVDVRNTSEVKEGKIFDSAISIPLYELRKRVNEIPTDKPVVVHCAGGYRSAAGSSIIQKELDVKAFDLGEGIKEFQTVTT